VTTNPPIVRISILLLSDSKVMTYDNRETPDRQKHCNDFSNVTNLELVPLLVRM
jgi:hypothetical protein